MAGRGRQRWWALAALGLAVLAVGMDATVLSVALPPWPPRCTGGARRNRASVIVMAQRR